MPQIMSAFHEVRTFSSRPGCTRFLALGVELAAGGIEELPCLRVRGLARHHQVPVPALEVGRPVEAEAIGGDGELVGR